jgi:hypothetical protein
MTWLNLLSVQPRGRTPYRFQDWPEKRTEPILSKRVLKDAGAGTGSVTLQIVRGKIMERSFDFGIR